MARSVNGIACRVEGNGTPVVLLHSGVTDNRMWDDLAGRLAPAHTVIRYDLRGFGASPPPESGFRHLDDLVAVLDALGVARATVVGNSMGGRLALDLAGALPARVAGLVLLAPPIGGWGWSAAMREYVAAEEAALDAGDVDEAVRLNMDMWVRGPARSWSPALEGVADRVRQPMRTALANQQATEALELDDEFPPVEQRLAELPMPAVVGIGDCDLPDFVEIARRLAADIPGARLVEFRGAGHLLPLEEPDRVSELVAVAAASAG